MIIKLFIIIFSSFISLFNNKKISFYNPTIKQQASINNLLKEDNLFYYPFDGAFKIKNEIKFTSNGTYQLSIIFKKNLSNFKEASRNNKLGYKINIFRSLTTIEEDYTYFIKTFSELFYLKENTYLPVNKSKSELDTYLSGKNIDNCFILKLTLNVQKYDKLTLFELFYSDTPIQIKNVILSPSILKDEEILQYNKVTLDSKNSEYSSYYGKSPSLNIDSQYGRIYSPNYLSNCFISYDGKSNTYFYPDEFEDEQGYFENGDKASLGSKYIIFLNAYNVNNEKSTITFNIKIVDTLPPTIKKIDTVDEITCSYKTNFDDPTFINKYFSIIDNYSSDIQMNILDENNNKITSTVSKIKAKIVAYDHFKNKSEFPFSLNLIDDISPIISKEYFFLSLNENFTLDSEEILNLFSAYDEIDKDTRIKLFSDTYSNNKEKEGLYIFTVITSDKSSNISKDSIEIEVKRNGPVFYANENYLKILDSKNLNDTDLINLLIKNGQIPDEEYLSISNNLNTNLQDLEVGKYDINFTLVDKNGQIIEAKMIVEIINSEIGENKELSFFEKVSRWFDNLFKTIGDFFKNLFH